MVTRVGFICCKAAVIEVGRDPFFVDLAVFEEQSCPV